MALGRYRLSRAHAHAIVGSFASDFPDAEDWWPLPGDPLFEEKRRTALGITQQISAKDFVKGIGAAFRGVD